MRAMRAQDYAPGGSTRRGFIQRVATPHCMLLAALVTAVLSLARQAEAAVLCAAKSGAVSVRTTCAAGEKRVNLGSLGIQSTRCAPDAVRVGNLCVDKYEASVWQIYDNGLRQRAKAGTLTRADLVGLPPSVASQHGASGDNYECPDTGNGSLCTFTYALSIAGVTPSRYLTWFQAALACRNAGKRLLTNAEWQAAAFRTPDGAPCIVNADDPGATGTPGCVSDVGVFDMVGNVWEWVGDWIPSTTACSPALYGTDDLNCTTIDHAAIYTPLGPAALIRGGSVVNGTRAGVFAVIGNVRLAYADSVLGFRCAR